jgi:hypothetical protein
MSTGDIAKFLSRIYYPKPVTPNDQVRYQHVRNVLHTRLAGE